MTDEINNLMYRAFSTCIVVDNKVQFVENFTKEEIYQIYDRFSRDLLDYKIPHYRVVGIYYMNALGSNVSVLRSHDGYSMSIIELGDRVRRIIPDTLGGNDPIKGCVISNTDAKAYAELVDEQGNKVEIPDMGISHCLRRSCEDIGQLAFDNSITTGMHQSDLYWLQFYIGEDADEVQAPKFLLDDFLISRTQKIGATENTIFFYKKGTGVVDFNESSRLFTNDCDVFPCRTVYDLSSFFMVKYPTTETNFLSLMVKEPINLNVLQRILREYGGEFNVD